MSESISITGGTTLLNPVAILVQTGVEEGDRIGDFGCGAAAHFTIPAARLVGLKGKVFAVDLLKSVLEGVNSRVRMENIKNIETVWSNLEVYKATKILDNTLDLGLVINVLFQTQKRAEMLKEVARMIKVNGKLLIIDWLATGAPFGPPLSDRVSKENIEKVVSGLGFEKIEDIKAGDYHFGIIFKKTK